MATTVLGFMLCTLVIFLSGRNLSRYGDIIAQHLGLGRAWVGLILMASVTSLPELVVGITASAVVESADLATGDVLGSCVFNLMILSLLDVFMNKKSIFSLSSSTHIMAGTMGIILISLAGLGIYLKTDIAVTSWIGITSIVFIAVYFLAIRVIFKFSRQSGQTQEMGPAKQLIPLRTATVRYIVNAATVVAAAIFLPGFAEKIATETGLDASFIGTLFLAASTSLPEVAVSFSAMRMGAIDMAVGNLLGSNLFNILILAVDDIFYTKGYLLQDASDTNLVSVFSVIIMTAITISGIAYHNQNKKHFIMAVDTFLILLIYIGNLMLLYHLSR